MKDILIFTDGSCLGNPGRGGWAAILCYGEHTKEIGGGCEFTTNNRMEMMAAIKALESLKESCQVTLYTDSQYLRNAIEKKWLQSWIKKDWLGSTKKPVKNKDLWQRLHIQLERHTVTLHWLRGHNGQNENERCDELAHHWAEQKNLPEDQGYLENQ